jgi:hypothetical protein
MFSRLDRTNVALVYAIKFGNAPHMKFIKDGLKDLGQLGFNILFNTLLYVVYALSFIALFLVLLSRVVAMWIAVVLSPLLALSIVVPQLKELAGGGGELQQKFVKGAIAPITIGLVLSVGYIMLEGFSMDKSIHGTILSSSTLEAIDPNSLPTSITDLQQLMVAVGIVVIVWTGVFGAAKDTVAGTVTEMIRSKAVDFGKWTAKLPTYLQAIPTGGKFGKKAVTLAEIGATISDIPGKMQLARGRSLLEGAPLSSKDLEPWQRAKFNGNIDNLAKAVSESAHVMKDSQGWTTVRDAIMASKGIKDDEAGRKAFADKYGSGPQDIEKMITAISGDSPLMGKIETESKGRIHDAASLRAAIEKKTVEPITSKESAIKAIKERSTAEIRNEKPFADPNVWSENLIEKIKLLPSAMQEAFIGWNEKKNEAQLAVPRERVLALAEIVSATTADAMRAAVTAAKGQAATNTEITQIINSKPPELKTVGETALGVVPAGTAATRPSAGSGI